MSLSITNLSKSYGNKVIFSKLSLRFKDKGLYVLSGDSGAGKTTLLRLIAGLDTEYGGEIVGGGINMISFAFQEYRLFPQLSAIDNVILANSDTKNEAEQLAAKSMLRRLGFADEDMNLFPSELSGGMKQRVSLARAFLKKSPILLLDEPTKELDAHNASLVNNIIYELSRERLVIVVSHDQTDSNEFESVKINIKS